MEGSRLEKKSGGSKGSWIDVDAATECKQADRNREDGEKDAELAKEEAEERPKSKRTRIEWPVRVAGPEAARSGKVR